MRTKYFANHPSKTALCLIFSILYSFTTFQYSKNKNIIWHHCGI